MLNVLFVYLKVYIVGLQFCLVLIFYEMIVTMKTCYCPPWCLLNEDYGSVYCSCLPAYSLVLSVRTNSAAYYKMS